MIFGRPTNLIVGAFTAVFNVVVLVLGTTLSVTIDAGLVAAVNLAFAAVIALVANQPPTVNEGSKYTVITPEGEPNRTMVA